MARVSPTNRSFIIAYTLLVGLPLLGLAGVLKAGYTLSAPISVDGAWTFGTSTTDLCGQALENSVLTISQSGKHLAVYLNHDANATATGTGTLVGATIEATLPLPAMGAGHCGNDASLVLKATIDSKSEPRTMQGTMSINGCASCSAMSYRAVRQSRSARRDAH